MSIFKQAMTTGILSLSVILGGCVSGGDTDDGSILQVDDELTPENDPSSFIGQVCEAPIYAQLLGFYQGEAQRSNVTGSRACTWEMTATFTGVDAENVCVVTGEIQTVVLAQTPNEASPYRCAEVNESFVVPGAVPFANLSELILPQTFALSFEPGSLEQFDDEGVPLFYPISSP